MVHRPHLVMRNALPVIILHDKGRAESWQTPFVSRAKNIYYLALQRKKLPILFSTCRSIALFLKSCVILHRKDTQYQFISSGWGSWKVQTTMGFKGWLLDPGTAIVSRSLSPIGSYFSFLSAFLFFPMNIQGWFPLGLTRWISLQSKGLSRVFSRTTV